MSMHENARLTLSGREWMMRRVLSEECAREVAGDVGVSERTAFKRLKRFREGGEAGLHGRLAALMPARAFLRC